MTTLEINEPEQLTSLGAAWTALLARTPDASFFQSHSWLQAYWRHFGAGQKLRLVVVLEADEVVGIVPLVVKMESTRVGALRTLTYPLDGWASFYGPVGEDPQGIAQAAFEHIRSTSRDWDLLDLRWIKNREPLAAGLAAADFRVDWCAWEEVALIDLAGGWDAYWQALGGHEQPQQFARALKRLEAMGPLAHVRHRPAGATAGDADPRWDLYEQCEMVAERSWQGNASDGTTLSNQAVRDFYRETHELAACEGALDMNLLVASGRPVAFAYNYHYRGYVYVMKVGFDPEFAHAGAGKVLLWKLVEDSFRRGDRLIDLGPESLHYKKLWLNQTLATQRATHFPVTSARAQALRVARWAREWMKESEEEVVK